MFGIGFSEILVIAVVAIVFVGPKRLPEVMKQLGRFFVHARRMSNDVRSTFDTVIQQAEQEIHLENLKKIKELTNGTLTQLTQPVVLEQQPYVPHPDDYPHHSEPHGTEHLGPGAATLTSPATTQANAEVSTATEKPDFDNHGKA